MFLNWDATIWQQVIGVIIFLGCVFVILFLSMVIIAGGIINLAVRKQLKPLTIKDKSVLMLAGIGCLCMLYGYFIEPYWLDVHTIQLTSNKIHPNKKPIRLIHISDLHCDSAPRLEEKLPAVIASLNPDIIVFTGDAINTPAGLPIFRKCLAQLAKIAPTYVVKGNWDSWYFKDLDRFGHTGAVELDAKPVKARLPDNDVWLAGLPVGTTKTVHDVMQGVSENAYRIFLFHYPDYINEMAHNKIDLYLAGHTHGGQVALPLYGALITLSPTGKHYESGLYNFDQTYLYVNRGIGMEGGKAPRIRFFARPEVTVIDVFGKSQ